MMPQLNSLNRAVQHIQTSGTSGKSGRTDQKDRFRDLLQNSPGKNSSKETAAGGKASDDKISKPEAAGKPEKQPASEAQGDVKERQPEHVKSEDGTPVDETLVVTAGIQMFPFLMESSPASQQIVSDAGALEESVQEMPLISDVIISAGGENETPQIQTVPGAELSVQTEKPGETSDTSDGFAFMMQETRAGDVLPADHQEQKVSLLSEGKDTVSETSMEEQPQNVQTAVQQTESPARQESGQSSEDGREEAEHTDGLLYSAGHVARPETAAVQIQETAGPQQPVHIRAGNSQELMNQLVQQLRDKTAVGKQEFEIQIHPENLGRLAIKVAYAAEKVTISIVCSNEKTMDALSAGAKNIAQIMEKNLGTPTTVVVDQQEENYLEQYKEQRNSQQQQQQEQEKKQEHTSEDSQDFLQQLRLGLI